VYSNASLVLEKDANGSYANGKVTISTGNSAPNAPMASISVADVYKAGENSVTISGSWDGSGTYTAKTSTGEEVSTSLSLSAAGGGADNFSVYGLGNGET
jgi:hypothetical protein